jgi:hypothetical protein
VKVTVATKRNAPTWSDAKGKPSTLRTENCRLIALPGSQRIGWRALCAAIGTTD